MNQYNEEWLEEVAGRARKKKSNESKVEKLIRELGKDNKIILVDPEKEYEMLVKELGVIDKVKIIDPLDIDESTKKELLNLQIDLNSYNKYLKCVNNIIYSKGIEIDDEWDIMNLEDEINNQNNLLEIEKRYLIGKLESYSLSIYNHFPVWKLNNCFKTSLAYRYTTSYILKIVDTERKMRWLNKIYKSLINDCRKGIISNSFASTIAFYLLEGTDDYNKDIRIYEDLNNLYNISLGG